MAGASDTFLFHQNGPALSSPCTWGSVWRPLLLSRAAQSYTVLSTPLCCYLEMKRRKKSIGFSQGLTTPYPRIPVEIELFPMLLWPVSDILITQSSLLGAMKEPAEGHYRQDNTVYFPWPSIPCLIQNIVGQMSGLWVIPFGSKIMNSGKMVLRWGREKFMVYFEFRRWRGQKAFPRELRAHWCDP